MKTPDLTRFTPDQLRKIRAKADFLLGSGADAVERHDDGVEEMVHNAICEQLGLEKPISVARRTKQFRTLRGNLDVVRELLKEFQPETKAEARRAVGVMVECLIACMERDGVPIRYGAVCGNMSRIAAAVDREFPRYLKGGNLRIVLEQAMSIV